MPVRLDDHDPAIDLRPGTTKSDIVAYLYRHSEWGYAPGEIRDALEIPHGTATTTLTRLHDEGYVGKTEDGYYHALDEREDLRRYVASLEQAHRLFGDHRDADATPEEPDERIGKGRTDRDLKREVEELEDKVGDMGG